jgi:uncharacterized SAM-dependent methyltransferase
LVGSNFAVRDWRHLSRFNAPLSRVEMHLQARHALTVQWPGGQRQFAADETIHTENACKWTVPNFDALLRSAGFASTHVWTDPAHRFAVFWAEA